MVEAADAGTHPSAIFPRSHRGCFGWHLREGYARSNKTLPRPAIREIEKIVGIRSRVLRCFHSTSDWYVDDESHVHRIVRHDCSGDATSALSCGDDSGSVVENVAWVSLNCLGEQLVYPNESHLVFGVRQLLLEAV